MIVLILRSLDDACILPINPFYYCTPSFQLGTENFLI